MSVGYRLIVISLARHGRALYSQHRNLKRILDRKRKLKLKAADKIEDASNDLHWARFYLERAWKTLQSIRE